MTRTAHPIPTINFPLYPSMVDGIRIIMSAFNKAELTFGHGYVSAFDEAWALVSHVTNLPFDDTNLRDYFLSARLNDDEVNQISLLAKRRINERIPLAYITGEAWLGGFSFPAEVGVIVPRSLLARPILERLSPWLPDDFTCHRALELCCGSASLMVLMAMAFPEAQVEGVDINSQALGLAEKTIAQYGLEDRIQIHQGDLYTPLTDEVRGTYDLIIANPPYVDDRSMENLPQEYRAEPKLALSGGKDGLDVVRRIIEGACTMLSPQGFLLLEMGDHAELLMEAFPKLSPILLNNDSEAACIALYSADDLAKMSPKTRKSPRQSNH